MKWPKNLLFRLAMQCWGFFVLIKMSIKWLFEELRGARVRSLLSWYHSASNSALESDSIEIFLRTKNVQSWVFYRNSVFSSQFSAFSIIWGRSGRQLVNFFYISFKSRSGIVIFEKKFFRLLSITYFATPCIVYISQVLLSKIKSSQPIWIFFRNKIFLKLKKKFNF